ncbi:MAG: hypothetical protein QM723_36855 [Myxococcaceae bacterium]
MLTLVVISGCEPDHGLRLTYSSGASSLPVVEARLKRLNAKYKVEAKTPGFVLTLPGAKPADAAAVKDLLAVHGTLELSFVVDVDPKLREGESLPDGVLLELDRYAKTPARHLVGPTRKAVEEGLAKLELPPGRSLVVPEDTGFRSWVLDDKPVLGNDSVASARVREDLQLGQPVIDLAFTPAGSTAFADATGKNVGRRLAIILDGRVESAPVVQERIPGGQARLTLGRGQPHDEQVKKAQTLALSLEAGALPEAPVLAAEEVYGSK